MTDPAPPNAAVPTDDTPHITGSALRRRVRSARFRDLKKHNIFGGSGAGPGGQQRSEQRWLRRILTARP